MSGSRRQASLPEDLRSMEEFGDRFTVCYFPATARRST